MQLKHLHLQDEVVVPQKLTHQPKEADTWHVVKLLHTMKAVPAES